MKSLSIQTPPFKQVVRGGAFLLFSFLLGCQGAIVDEEYATFNRKSINGVDALYGLLEGDGRRVIRAPFLTRKIMETADVIVYFSPGIENPEELARFESWMHAVPYRPPAGEDILKPAEAGRRLRPALQEPVPGPEAPTVEAEEEETTEEEAAEPEEESESEEPAAAEETVPEEDLPPTRESPVTVLYFERDTDASVPFWDALRQQMEGNEKEVEFAREYLELRLEDRQENPAHESTLLGTRKMLDAAGKPLDQIWVHPLLSSTAIPDFPVRFVPDLPASRYEDVELPFRTLIETRQGYDLMREFLLQQGRVIVSYNSEWALNYSLVRKPYRDLAGALVRYALSHHGSTEPVKIYWITRSLAPIEAGGEEADGGLLRPFFEFPLNVILIQILFLLVLYLLSRWPHEKRPAEENGRGKREFLEHIRFLGEKLRRSRNPFDALEPLGAYVKRGRFDPRLWEEAIAALFAKDGVRSQDGEAEKGKEQPRIE